ncbi:uncharacterized protein LOC111875056 [Cryptotermes secundus]|uniref:uncharacterized protein LOC111875056 n=1 Tax=Cryptotermes secundus TaxID=105785 RepID=UPI000CD7CB07|nr:uncharacterized protein LOC111875056 [Cryptotermes secundus]
MKVLIIYFQQILVFLRNVIKERCPRCVVVAVAITAIYFLHCLMEGYISHTVPHFLIIFFLAVLTERFIRHRTLRSLIIFFLAVLPIKMGSTHTTVLEILSRWAYSRTDEFMRTFWLIHENSGISGLITFVGILKWLNDIYLVSIMTVDSSLTKHYCL